MNRKNDAFVRVTKIWTIMFSIFGLSFLFTPQLVGRQLTWLANLIGLSGQITAPSGTIWWALSISLMSTIIALGFACIRYPMLTAPYYALMTAKIASTAAFLWLSIWHGPAWWICAFGDGFVALTIWGSRRMMKRPRAPKGFARRYHGAGPLNEEFYGKVNVEPGLAFWFRYTILHGKDEEASVWGILFDGDEVKAARRSWPLSDLAPGNVCILPDTEEPERFRGKIQTFHIGGSRLDETNAIGDVGDLRWDLRWRANGRRHSHVSRWLRRLGLIKTSYESCMIDLRISGEIVTDGRTIVVPEAPGMVGHIEGGRKSADSWAWAHCNQFEGEDDAVFEGLTAMAPVGGKMRGPLSSFVLYLDGKKYGFSSPLKLAKPRSVRDAGRWTFSLEEKGRRLSGEARIPERYALVEYTDTDGSKLWCRNSKLADLTVRFQHPRRRIDRELIAKGAAAFEWVDRTPPRRHVDL